MSQGSVEVSVNEKGEKTIKVGDDSVTIKKDGTKETTGNGIKEDGDGTDDIVITGDNTKPTESLNAEEENTSEVEKSGENTSEVEKSGETKGEGKTQSPARARIRAMSPLLRSCWPRRTRSRRTRRSPPTLRSREADRKDLRSGDRVRPV